jgi:gas vesicle protein
MPREEIVRVVERESDVATRLTYFALGGAIGALVALLFAPKSGQELRSDIADATRKGVDRTRETANQISARAGEYYQTVRERASELAATASQKAGELADNAREAVAGKKDQLNAAISAGKQAYREERERLAPGDSGANE